MLLGYCRMLQVACGSGLELVYEFLLSDERANRPEVVGAAEGDEAKGKKVRAGREYGSAREGRGAGVRRRGNAGAGHARFQARGHMLLLGCYSSPSRCDGTGLCPQHNLWAVWNVPLQPLHQSPVAYGATSGKLRSRVPSLVPRSTRRTLAPRTLGSPTHKHLTVESANPRVPSPDPHADSRPLDPS